MEIKYYNKEKTRVEIIDGENGFIAPYPCETYHAAIIQDWIDEGNTIAPYVEVIDPNQWQTDRREAYGTIRDQLDMIYHDMDVWKKHIAQVKAEHPK